MTRATTSASNLHRRALCPGSACAEEGLAEEDSEYSAEGTLMHKLDADPAAPRTGLTREQLDVLERSAALSGVVYAEAAVTFGFTPDEPYEGGRERGFVLHRGIRTLLPGHCDEWRYYPRLRLLVIIDKKFGYLEVTAAAANKQLRAYAVMGAEEHGCDAAVVAITQPRLPFDQRLTMAAYTQPDIQKARHEIYGIWDGSYDRAGKPLAEAPRVAGEEQCRYCKAKTSCPVYLQQLAPVGPGSDVRLGAIETASDAQLDNLFRAIWFAEKIKDTVQGEIRSRLDGGNKTLPYDLSPNGSRRKVSDPVLARALVVGSGTLTGEEYDACAAPAIGKLETKVREKTGCKAPEAKATINGLLSDVIENTETKDSLTRRPVPALTENPTS